MSATIHGLTTLTFAIASNETGVITQRISNNVKSGKKEVMDHDGNYAAVASAFAVKAEATITGYRSTGISANVGGAFTPINTLGGFGCAPSVWILDEASEESANQDFVQQTAKISGYVFP